MIIKDIIVIVFFLQIKRILRFLVQMKMNMVPLIRIWVEFGRGILNRQSIKGSPFNDCPDPDVRTNVPTVRCSRILNDQNFEHTGGTHECCSLEWMMLLLSQHAPKKNYLSDLLILELTRLTNIQGQFHENHETHEHFHKN